MATEIERASWRDVHAGLRQNAQRRVDLDVEEARWLRRAEQVELWKQFGCATLMAYLERELGYAPREARERLRIARALGELPQIEGALANGELPYSAVRELARVATRATEAKWLDKAKGRSLREIEDLVSGRRPGDDPETPPDPEARLRRLSFDDIAPATYALLRQARVILANECGESIDDDALLAAAFRALLDREAGSARAVHQIAVTICEYCRRGRQLGGGRAVVLSAAETERAACDAVHIGSVDGKPTRAQADVPPATRRLVLQRDQGRCTVPGCRSARHLDLHHIKHRVDGGDHDPTNLTTLCGFHHKQTHEGKLEVHGRAPDELTYVRHDAGTRLAPDRVESEVRAALVQLGFQPVEARAAVAEAMTHVGHAEVTLESLLERALRCAPKPLRRPRTETGHMPFHVDEATRDPRGSSSTA